MATLPLIPLFWHPIFESASSIMGAWSLTWVGFNIFALVITLILYRRNYERWAWYTLWLSPLLWLSHLVFSPDFVYLMLALVTTVALVTTAGLVLTYQRFFLPRGLPGGSAR